MILSEVSIKRPVFATMLNLVLVVFGLFSLPRLAVDLYPNVDFPVVTVSVLYPGADPESVEQRVLDPLEKALNGISQLKTLTSNGYPNLGQIILQFELEKKSDVAVQEVRDKVFATLQKLPKEAETPIVQKFDIGGAPILTLSFHGDMTVEALSQLAKDRILPQLERVPGVAHVNQAGIREKEVHVLLDLDRLASFGLTPADIASSIQQQNMDLPSGKLETELAYRSIRVKGKLAQAEELGQLPILNNRGLHLHILDVAEVRDTLQEEENAAFVGKQRTILFFLQKQSDASTTTVVEEAKKAVAKLALQLPASAGLEIVSDNSRFIKGSIDSVKLDLLLGALLAILIVLLFLRDPRITLISAAALPTAVIGTFAFMEAFGFTLNMMTTLALSLSIGILIDDAIIVVENIHRHLAMGKSALQATSDATSEIGLAVLATTLSLCAVFVPVAFMKGIVGRFFFQFGITVTVAVLISLFVAFTLTPMMASQFLQHGEGHKKHKKRGPLVARLVALSQKVENLFLQLESRYRSLLVWCLGHRLWTLLGGLGIFVLSIVMVRFVPVSFFAKMDRSEFALFYTLPEGSSLAFTQKESFRLAEAVQSYPGVNKVFLSVGTSQDQKVNKSQLTVSLIPREERGFSQYELMDRMRKDLVPLFMAGETKLSIGEVDQGGGRGSAIQFILKSDKWDELVTYSHQVEDFVRKNLPDAMDLTTSLEPAQKELRVRVDTAQAADLSVSPAQIAQSLRTLFEGEKVGEVEKDGVTSDVRLRVQEGQRVSAQDVSQSFVLNRQGEKISLHAVAALQEGDAPSGIHRTDGQRQISVMANYSGKDLNTAIDKIQRYIKETHPASITASLSGEGEIMKDSIASMMQALLLAILLVYMILCAQYESYSAPLVIMGALPLSLSGAFGALLLTGQAISIYTMIGIILLMGLVTKNGILLIDFTLQRMKEGLSVSAALIEAGPVRLRPILMTTFAAAGGMLPVAIGHGMGGEARAPMGVAVIGGLLMSTLLTLVIVPCLFSVVEERKQRRRQAAAT